MDTGISTLIIFFVLIFGSLEIIFVVIPAMVSSMKVRQTFQPDYEIPRVLAGPVQSDQAIRMRSWYATVNDSHRYIRRIDLDCLLPENTSNKIYPETDSPVGTWDRELSRAGPEPVRDWKAVNRANWAIQRANEAVREANRKIREANVAIEQAGEDGLEWMDQIAEVERLRLRPKI